MTELILVRHGRTSANAEGLYCGRLDLPLLDEAIEEVAKTALVLSAFSPHRVYCSDSLRARQTAEIIVPNSAAVFLPSLREMDFGTFEGLSADEIQLRNPDLWQAYMKGYMDFTFPEGDNVSSYLTKSSEWINGIIRENKGSCMLIISHKGFILSALSHLLHGDSKHIFCYDIRPAGFARLSIGDGYAILKQLT